MSESWEQAAQRLCTQIANRGRNRGFLVAFEGPDGAGKSTQRKLFKAWLKVQGLDVVTTKWNSSPLIKPIIKARKSARSLDPREFSLLHAADFRHRMETEILPALVEGKIVIADRFLFTGLARDAARGLDLHWLLHVYAPLYWPDAVFYLSVAPETSGIRIAATRQPKYYEAGQDVTNIDDPHESYDKFIRRVIQEYDALSVIFNFIKVDAEGSIQGMHQRIRNLFEEVRHRPLSKWNEEAIADWLRSRHHQQRARGARISG
jgi:dTMP kinase